MSPTRGLESALDVVLEMVRDRVDDIDRDRRLPDDVVLALRGTGVNRLALPTVLGGCPARSLDLVEVIERIAAVDASTAWCTAVSVGTNLTAGYMSESGARTVFEDPDQGNTSLFAPTGTVVRDNGHGLLTGRWPFTSNCLHSSWVGLAALAHGDDGVADPVPRIVFAPADEITIEDTWDVLGLRGTGSHHTSAMDLAVDLECSFALSAVPWPDEALWRLPLFTVLVPMLAAVPLGAARGALDEVARQAREGNTSLRGQLSESAVSMAELGVADAKLRGARAALHDELEEAHLIASRGDPIQKSLQARILLACQEATDVGLEVASVAHRLGSDAAVYSGSQLLRALHDIETAQQHIAFAHTHRAELGKAAAGIDITYPPLII
jgi:alkylation response protein AidB-like acyl-CoA dehydrogenase